MTFTVISADANFFISSKAYAFRLFINGIFETKTNVSLFHTGDDCRPIHVVLHKFMNQPILPRADAIVALEFANVSVHKHLLKLGEPGYCPPCPKVSDIMYYR